MPLDPRCQSIADEIAGLETELARAEEELRDAPPSETHWSGVVQRLTKQISQRRLALEACIAAHPPSEPPLT